MVSVYRMINRVPVSASQFTPVFYRFHFPLGYHEADHSNRPLGASGMTQLPTKPSTEPFSNCVHAASFGHLQLSCEHE
jgi:hypothetical protein